MHMRLPRTTLNLIEAGKEHAWFDDARPRTMHVYMHKEELADDEQAKRTLSSSVLHTSLSILGFYRALMSNSNGELTSHLNQYVQNHPETYLTFLSKSGAEAVHELRTEFSSSPHPANELTSILCDLFGFEPSRYTVAGVNSAVSYSSNQLWRKMINDGDETAIYLNICDTIKEGSKTRYISFGPTTKPYLEVGYPATDILLRPDDLREYLKVDNGSFEDCGLKIVHALRNPIAITNTGQIDSKRKCESFAIITDLDFGDKFFAVKVPSPSFFVKSSLFPGGREERNFVGKGFAMSPKSCLYYLKPDTNGVYPMKWLRPGKDNWDGIHYELLDSLIRKSEAGTSTVIDSDFRSRLLKSYANVRRNFYNANYFSRGVSFIDEVAQKEKEIQQMLKESERTLESRPLSTEEKIDKPISTSIPESILSKKQKAVLAKEGIVKIEGLVKKVDILQKSLPERTVRKVDAYMRETFGIGLFGRERAVSEKTFVLLSDNVKEKKILQDLSRSMDYLPAEIRDPGFHIGLPVDHEGKVIAGAAGFLLLAKSASKGNRWQQTPVFIDSSVLKDFHCSPKTMADPVHVKIDGTFMTYYSLADTDIKDVAPTLYDKLSKHPRIDASGYIRQFLFAARGNLTPAQAASYFDHSGPFMDSEIRKEHTEFSLDKFRKENHFGYDAETEKLATDTAMFLADRLNDIGIPTVVDELKEAILAYQDERHNGGSADIDFSFSLSSGIIYGYVQDNTIHLTPEGINPNTPIHEYAHLWAYACQRVQPERWEKLKEELRSLPQWDTIVASSDYSHLAGDENRLAGEVLAHLVGDKGEELLLQASHDVLEEGRKTFFNEDLLRDGLSMEGSQYVEAIANKTLSAEREKVSDAILSQDGREIIYGEPYVYEQNDQGDFELSKNSHRHVLLDDSGNPKEEYFTISNSYGELMVGPHVKYHPDGSISNFRMEAPKIIESSISDEYVFDKSGRVMKVLPGDHLIKEDNVIRTAERFRSMVTEMATKQVFGIERDSIVGDVTLSVLKDFAEAKMMGERKDYGEFIPEKKSTGRERGGAIAGNPSSIDLSYERKVRLNRQSLSHSSDDTKISNSTVLFAPNGKISNLSKEDYEYIRSRTFRYFAGDWESARIIRQARNAWGCVDSRERTNFIPSERFISEVQNVTGLNIRLAVITDDQIRHIKNHHSVSEDKRGQGNLTPEDIAVIPYVINNFDSIVRAPQYDDVKGGLALTISKRVNGVTYVGTINKGKRNEVIITAWHRNMSAALDASKDTPGLYVRNDTDLIAKVKKDIEIIKRSADFCQFEVDANGEPTKEVIDAVRRIESIDMEIAQAETSLFSCEPEEHASIKERITSLEHSIEAICKQHKITERENTYSSLKTEFNIHSDTLEPKSSTEQSYAPSPLDLSSVELTPIEKELVQMVAERIHQAWYAERLREGVTSQDNPLMKPWSELSAEERVSSLDSAEQAVKAAKVKFGTLDEFASGRAELNPAAVVDAIAVNAHEVWAKQRMDAGWTYGEVRDNDAKKHPMLIPYSEVPEKEKEKEYDKDYGRHVVSSLQTLSRRHYTIAEKDAYHMEDGRLIGQKGDDFFITGLKIKDIRRSDSTGLLVATYESPVLSRGGMWYALVEPETGAVVYDARLSPLDQSFETGDIVIRPYLKRSSVLVEDDRHIEFEKPNNENRLLVYDKNTGKHSTIHAASGTRIRINGETYFKITNDSNQEVQLVSPKGEFVLPEGFHEPISILRVGEKPYVLTSRMGMNYLLDIEKGVPVEKSMNMNTDQYGQFSMPLTGAKVLGMVLGEKPFYMTEKNISGSRHPIVHGDGVFNIITDEGRPFFSKDVSIQEAFGKELPDGIAKNDGSLGIHPMSEIELNGKKYCIIYIDDDVKESVNIFSEDGKKVFPESLVSLRTISKEPHKDTVDLFTRITICGRDYLQTRHDFGQSHSGTDRFQFETFDPETGEFYMKSRTCILPDPLVPGAVRIPLCDKEGMWQGIDLVVSDKGDITFYKRENDKDFWLVSTPEKFRPSDAMADVSIKDGYIIMQNQETGNLSIWSQDGKKCLVDHEKGQIVERRRFPIVGAKETYIRLNGIEIPLKRLVENRKAPKLAVADGKSERRKDISDQGSSTSIGNQTEIPVGFIKAVADDELRQDRNRPADPSRSPEKVYDSILYPDENEALGAIGTVGHAVRDENGDKVVVGIRYDEGTGKTTCKREKVDDIKKKFGVDDAEDKRNVIIPVKVGDQIHELKVPKSLAEDLARGKSVTVSEIRINYDPFLGACALTKDYQKVHYYELSNSEKMKEARQQKTQAAKQSLSSPEPKKASGGKKI